MRSFFQRRETRILDQPARPLPGTKVQQAQPPCPSKKDFTAARQKGGTIRAW